MVFEMGIEKAFAIPQQQLQVKNRKITTVFYDLFLHKILIIQTYLVREIYGNIQPQNL